jgi:hypothetical protein
MLVQLAQHIQAIFRREYIDWPKAVRPRDRSLIPNRAKNFLLIMSSTPVLGFTQFSIQWILDAVFQGKRG